MFSITLLYTLLQPTSFVYDLSILSGLLCPFTINKRKDQGHWTRLPLLLSSVYGLLWNSKYIFVVLKSLVRCVLDPHLVKETSNTVTPYQTITSLLISYHTIGLWQYQYPCGPTHRQVGKCLPSSPLSFHREASLKVLYL